MKQLHIEVDYASNTYFASNNVQFVRLKQLVESHYAAGAYTSSLKSKQNQDLLQWVTSVTSRVKCSLATRCYLILHGMHEVPKCVSCGAEVCSSIASFKKGF